MIFRLMIFRLMIIMSLVVEVPDGFSLSLGVRLSVCAPVRLLVRCSLAYTRSVSVLLLIPQ